MSDAAAVLDAVVDRAAAKRLAARVDGDPALREAIVALARARGVALPDDAPEWPAKKLLRRARGVSETAQARATPIARDEAFVCGHCGRGVPPAGHTARDHCPWCLRSVHVDVVPGDRAAGCGGRMDPVGLEVRGDTITLSYRCARCGHTHRVRALERGAVPDDPAALRRVSQGALP